MSQFTLHRIPKFAEYEHVWIGSQRGPKEECIQGVHIYQEEHAVRVQYKLFGEDQLVEERHIHATREAYIESLHESDL